MSKRLVGSVVNRHDRKTYLISTAKGWFTRQWETAVFLEGSVTNRLIRLYTDSREAAETIHNLMLQVVANLPAEGTTWQLAILEQAPPRSLNLDRSFPPLTLEDLPPHSKAKGRDVPTCGRE